MKYNFRVKAELTPAQTDEFNTVAPGLQVTGLVETRVQIDANTELPEEMVTALHDKIAENLGGVDLEFVSSEH